MPTDKGIPARCRAANKGVTMNKRHWLRFVAAAGICGVASLALAPGVVQAAGKDAQRAEARKVANQTLQRLYKVQPGAKQRIQTAAGYAAFSNFGMKILVAGGGKGEGVAVNNKTRHETFMKMLELQAGLGFGIKKFRLVWVFDTAEAFDKFVNSGWELGAQATAAAQVKGQGGAAAGAIPISPGVWIYQLTDDGLALELTAKGTKYYKDDELN
jgi:lipid-binding SYLF domain-containing protein